MIINKKYIRIPAGIGGRKKAICFKENDELIFDVEVDYKEEDPDFVFYQPTLPIMGKSVNIYIDDKEISLEQTDEKDDNGIGAETLRPYIHFSARRGWINDPNGLCFDGKKYHMFFQHNPVGILWGNMHWGHAISYDLLNWQETDDVLFPDKFGTMYSGSAIIDKNNVSGLSKNGEDVLCLFYTSCGNTSNGGNSKLSYGMESLQHLAYSNDGGITFTKYEGNPIVSGITKENRDPKVIYADEIGMYIMALYLENNDYMLLTSKDLIHWEERQRISIEGETECPDIYPLTVENEPRRLWVMSGAADKYLVGEIFPSGDLFRPIQCVKSYQPQRGSYAAQTFSGIENRRIKTAWGTTPAPNCIFNNQMAIFTEVSLVKIKNEYYLRTNPISEYDSLLSEISREDVYGEKSWVLPEGAYQITIIPDNNTEKVSLEIGGKEFSLNCKENLMADGDITVPLSYSGKEYTVRFIRDTLGIECFADGGLIHYATAHIGKMQLSINTFGGSCFVSVESAASLRHSKSEE